MNAATQMQRGRDGAFILRPSFFIYAIALFLAACGDPQAKALKQLGAKGYALSVSEFVRAARAGDSEALRCFVQAGMEPDLAGSDGRTALEAAVSAGKAAAVETLLSCGAQWPAAKNHELLVEAVASTSQPTVELLLEHGLRPEHGRRPSPLVLAAQARLSGVVEVLLPCCAEAVQEAVFAAAASGDVVALSKLVRAGGSLWAVDGQQRSPLIIAAASGQEAAVDLMLASGVDTWQLDQQQRCALEHARAAGHEDIVRKLSGIALKDEVGGDPLDTASLRTRGDAADVLDLGRLVHLRSLLEPLPFFLQQMEDAQAEVRLLADDRLLKLREGQSIPGTRWIVGASKSVPPFTGLVVHLPNGTGSCWLPPGRRVGHGRLAAVLRDSADGHLYLAKVGDTFSITGTSTLELRVNEVTDLWVNLGEASGSGRSWTLNLGGRRL